MDCIGSVALGGELFLNSPCEFTLLLPGADTFLWGETEAGRELYFILELEQGSVTVQVRKLSHRGCSELLQGSYLHPGLLTPPAHRRAD